jgi:ABC-type polar amino acid transport system ATPase subunit
LPSTESTTAPTPPILRFENVVKRFGHRTIIDGLSLDVQPGEVICLVGPSGTGKSTLLRCVNGLEQIQGGRIIFEGQEVNAHSRSITAIRRHIGMIFQSFNLYPHLTALQNVTLVPIKVQGEARASAEARARELFRKVRLDHRADAYPGQLSGGEQQRVAIARALATRPSLLMFDEPTSALDPETVNDVLEVMEDLAREGRTMLVVTHEIGFARDVGTRMVLMNEGRIVEDAPPAEMLANPKHERTRQFLSSISRV